MLWLSDAPPPPELNIPEPQRACEFTLHCRVGGVGVGCSALPPPASPDLAPGQVCAPQPPALHPNSSWGLGKRFLVPRLYTPGTYLLLNFVFCCVFSHNPHPHPKSQESQAPGAWKSPAGKGTIKSRGERVKASPSYFPTLYNSPGNKQEGLLPFTLGKFKDFLWSGGTVPQIPGAMEWQGRKGTLGGQGLCRPA